ncbi:MAG: SDR family NAD(P)-dependent oxidoreductase [Anaeromyxobacter sp.]
MSGRVAITGGAGFIGANLAHRLLSSGVRVRLLDNLSRPGVERNLAWLVGTHGDRVELVRGDVRDRAAVETAVEGAAAVFHLAAQVAVTTSLNNPLQDFAVNALGTLHLLEAVRREDPPPFVLYTSTNKVYGALEDVALADVGTRYAPVDPALTRGIDERRGLAFHSPYGCSKGAAEQYVLDWSRTYGVPATVFRMSCIYGTRQMGNEDQGWVAHFLLQALAGRPITLYGDGKQVRDVLFVDDLVDAMLLARERPREVAGRAFNIGGGPLQTVSLIELLELVGGLTGERPRVLLEDWRLADQRWYVSDPGRFGALTGWAPRVGVREGVARLHAWLEEALRPRPAAVAEASP